MGLVCIKIVIYFVKFCITLLPNITLFAFIQGFEIWSEKNYPQGFKFEFWVI